MCYQDLHTGHHVMSGYSLLCLSHSILSLKLSRGQGIRFWFKFLLSIDSIYIVWFEHWYLSYVILTFIFCTYWRCTDKFVQLCFLDGASYMCLKTEESLNIFMYIFKAYIDIVQAWQWIMSQNEMLFTSANHYMKGMSVHYLA